MDTIELNWLSLCGYLSQYEVLQLSCVCSKWRALLFEHLDCFIQPSLSEFPAGNPGPYKRASSPFYKCLAKDCGFNGTVQNNGFCSLCAKKPSNNPSEQTLAEWFEFCKSVDAKDLEEHNARLNRWNSIVGSHMQFLSRVKNLKSFKSPFHLTQDEEDEVGPQEFLSIEFSFLASRFSHSLRCLNIPYMMLDDSAIEIIVSSFPDLVHLNIRQSNLDHSDPFITSKGYSRLNALTKLEHLDISIEEQDSIRDAQMTGSVLKSLTALTNLKVLIVMECIFRGDNDPFTFVHNFPSLETLSLANSRGIEYSEDTLVPLQSLPCLRVLDLRALIIPMTSLYAITGTSLHYLFLQGVRDLTKEFIQNHIFAMKCLKGIGFGKLRGSVIMPNSEIEELFKQMNATRQQPIELIGVINASSDREWSDNVTPCIHCKPCKDIIIFK